MLQGDSDKQGYCDSRTNYERCVSRWAHMGDYARVRGLRGMPIHLQREIESVKRQILTLSAIVEKGVRQAVRSVSERDSRLANQVIELDSDIDQMEVDIEEECLKILALHQPVAIDLRFVIAVMKINNDLERVGDLAVNIAERTLFLAAHDPIALPYDLGEMSEKTQAMLRKSLDALMSLDAALAHQVCVSDDDVDEINRQMFGYIQTAIQRTPDQVQSLINYLSVSRNLERIADYATNIAEDVIYMIEGEIVRHRTEKPDPSTAHP